MLTVTTPTWWCLAGTILTILVCLYSYFSTKYRYMKVTPKLSPGNYKYLYHISNSCRDILPKTKRRLNLLVAIESELVLSKSEGFILPLMCLYIQGKFKSMVLDICHSRPQWRTRHPHPVKYADAESENALVFCLSWGLLASNLRSGLIIFCLLVMCFFFGPSPTAFGSM